MKRNAALDVVEDELKAATVPYRISGGGERHYKVRFVGGDGQPALVTVASSNSHGNNVHDARATVRRLLRGRPTILPDADREALAAAHRVRDIRTAKAYTNRRAARNARERSAPTREELFAAQLKPFRTAQPDLIKILDEMRMARWRGAKGMGLRDW